MTQPNLIALEELLEALRDDLAPEEEQTKMLISMVLAIVRSKIENTTA